MPTFAIQPIPTPLGEMLAGVTEHPEKGDASVCLLEFADRPRLPRELRELETALGTPPETTAHPLHDTIAQRLAAYFAGDLEGCPDLAQPGFNLPLFAPGTVFQREVWNALLQIPLGETTSYGELATRIGRTNAQRAVGAANGANRVSLAIPCHRVIESTGALRGYGGGLDRKRWLLTHERAMAGETLFATS